MLYVNLGRIFCTLEKFYVNHDVFVLRVFLRVIIGNEFVRTRRAGPWSRRGNGIDRNRRDTLPWVSGEPFRRYVNRGIFVPCEVC